MPLPCLNLVVCLCWESERHRFCLFWAKMQEWWKVTGWLDNLLYCFPFWTVIPIYVGFITQEPLRIVPVVNIFTTLLSTFESWRNNKTFDQGCLYQSLILSVNLLLRKCKVSYVPVKGKVLSASVFLQQKWMKHLKCSFVFQVATLTSAPVNVWVFHLR